MDRYEEAVMHYLTANGGTFVVHQYSIGQGWACPAFVAIQPSARMVCALPLLYNACEIAKCNGGIS
jgi:hypothetical protein